MTRVARTHPDPGGHVLRNHETAPRRGIACQAMPTVLRVEGYRFFFFSNEGQEPPHVHVERGDAYAKLWLGPVSLASSEGFKRPERPSGRASASVRSRPPPFLRPSGRAFASVRSRSANPAQQDSTRANRPYA